MGPIAWLLNFDAELELARPLRYQPSRRILQLCERFAPRAAGLLAPGDLVLTRPTQPGAAAGHFGRAWCPTPHARRELRRAGARLAPAPPLHSLQHANSRRLLASFGCTLPGALYTRSRREVAAYVARLEARGCVLKREHGFAGRGVRHLRGLPRPDDWHWIDTALGVGGVLMEPRVQILTEYSQHAYLPQRGAPRLGAPCQQRTDDSGRWLATEALAADQLDPALRDVLTTAVRRCAALLRRVGYFGPFGLDAYSYELPAGGRGVNPYSDLNARYTMGYAAGMGATASASRRFA